jgi:acyl-CoA thioesterase-1
MRAQVIKSGLARQFIVLAFVAAVQLACAGIACATIKIVAIGTSNTFGRYVARNEAYPAKLEAALRAKGYDVRVVNAGKNGDTLAGGLARLESDVPSDTQIAIVEFGANDRHAGMPAGVIQASLGQIVDRLRARKVEVLVANFIDVPGGAGSHGALFVNYTVSQYPMSLRLAEDPLHHLSPAGYDTLVARMLPAVESLLKRIGAQPRSN